MLAPTPIVHETLPTDRGVIQKKSAKQQRKGKLGESKKGKEVNTKKREDVFLTLLPPRPRLRSTTALLLIHVNNCALVVPPPPPPGRRRHLLTLLPGVLVGW